MYLSVNALIWNIPIYKEIESVAIEFLICCCQKPKNIII